MDRADMINSLALAMGVNTVKQNTNSKYATKTGTIYCNGRPVSDDTITNAINYFEAMRKKCEKSEVRDIKTVATYYSAAIEALEALKLDTKMGSIRKMAM